MQARVIAIVAARRGGAALRQTLDALAHQTRRPDLLVVVDAAGTDEATAQLAAANPTQFVTAPSTLTFGELIQRAVDDLPAPEPVSSPYGGVAEWLWLLRHDTEPDPRALERLLAAVEIAPSVAVAGPKQMDAAHPAVIASYGETITRWGASIAIAERELDQAQHDRTIDLLAVGEAGMLVRRTAFTAVNGFDPAMPPTDAALDFCVRIRLAGHRVMGVPQARVFVHESSARAARPGSGRALSDRVLARMRRTAQLHRRLVYAPAVAVPLHWLSLLPLAAARAIGLLLRKEPGRVTGEFRAALTVAVSFAAVAAARRRLARTRTVGWSAITPLRMPSGEVRRRRAIARDAALSRVEDDRPIRPDFVPGGAWLVALFAAVGAIVFAPLLGAPALRGGALVPLATDLTAAFDALSRSTVGAADPFAFVLTGLALLTPWQPSFVLGLLWVLALPLAALGGWWAASAVVRHPAPAAIVAVLWALSPALLSALAAGRPAAVIVHLALPVLVVAAARAHRSWSANAVAGLTAAVVTASAPSLLPALIAAWLVGMLARPRRLARLLTLAVPTLALLVPLAFDQLWRGTPLGLLADPGLPVAPGAPSPSGLLLGWPDLALVLTPLTTLTEAVGLTVDARVLAISVAVATLPLVVAAVAALALPTGRRAVAPLGVAAVGVVTAWALSGVAVAVADGLPVPLDVGPALSLAAIGLVLAAAIALDAARAGADTTLVGSVAPRGRRVLATSLGVTLVVCATALALPAVTTMATGGGAVQAGPLRTLPALVAAEALAQPGIGTIVLRPDEGAGAENAADAENGFDADNPAVVARIDRGAGRTLIEQSSLAATAALATRSDVSDPHFAALADLVGNLTARSGRDVTPALAELDVRFVLLEGDDVDASDANAASGAASDATAASALGDATAAASRSDIVAALDANPALASVGDTDTGRLWRVVAVDPQPAPPLDAPAGSEIVLGVQLSILALTLLLAVPTSLRPRRAAERNDPVGPAATFEPEGEDD